MFFSPSLVLLIESTCERLVDITILIDLVNDRKISFSYRVAQHPYYPFAEAF